MANHVIKRVTARTDTSVPFSLGAPVVRGNPKVRRFFKLRKEAPGFISHERTLSADKLTMTQITTWESPEAAKAFRDKYPRLTRQVMRIMGGYTKRKGQIGRTALLGPDGAELPPANPTPPTAPTP